MHYGIWFDELLSDRKSYFAFLYVGWHIWWSGDRENLPNWLLWQDWAEYPSHETWMPGLIMLFCPPSFTRLFFFETWMWGVPHKTFLFLPLSLLNAHFYMHINMCGLIQSFWVVIFFFRIPWMPMGKSSTWCTIWRMQHCNPKSATWSGSDGLSQWFCWFQIW